jgi:integrase
VTLEKARKKANDALTAVSDGIDPQQQKRAARVKADDLFPSAVDSFIDGYCKHHNRASTAAETERLLRAVYVPRWKTRRLQDLTKRDVLDVLDDIMAQNKPSAARHAFSTVRKFFSWCVERELIDLSPCLTIKPPAKANNRDRVLNDTELAAILEVSIRQGWPFGPIVQLLALTAQRRGEVVGMQWDEIDLVASVWTTPGPAPRTTVHTLSRSPQASSRSSRPCHASHRPSSFPRAASPTAHTLAIQRVSANLIGSPNNTTGHSMTSAEPRPPA